MKILRLIFILLLIISYDVSAQNNDFVSKEYVKSELEKEQLKRDKVIEKIESNSKLIDERRKDFEEVSGDVDSTRNLFYFLFSSILVVLGIYIPVDIFNKRNKIKELNHRVDMLERVIKTPNPSENVN